MDVNEFVKACYKQFLKREPEPGAVSHWGNVTRQNGGEKVVKLILSSEEYRNRAGSNDQFVRNLYLDVLGREADPAYAGGVKMLDSGAPHSQVIDGILGSPEFQTKMKDANTPGKEVAFNHLTWLLIILRFSYHFTGDTPLDKKPQTTTEDRWDHIHTDRYRMDGPSRGIKTPTPEPEKKEPKEPETEPEEPKPVGPGGDQEPFVGS